MENFFRLQTRIKTVITLVSILFLAGLPFEFAAASTHAQPATETGWLINADHPHAKTRLVLTGQIDPARKTVEGFLEISLDKGWKTYWRSPGEGGIAPTIDWAASSNLDHADWHWPFPQQFELLGLHTIGYKGDTVIPLTFHVKDWNQPVTLHGEFSLSSCTTICVLTEYPITLSFIPGKVPVSEQALFTNAQAISNVPTPSPLVTSTQAGWQAKEKLLTVQLTKDSGWTKPEIIVDGKTEESKDYSFKFLDSHIDGDTLTATFEVSSWLGDITFDKQSVYISVKDDAFLAEQAVEVGAAIIHPTEGTSSNSLLQMLFFALIGGLILNVMPCVLPVLGMKLSSVISAQGLERRQIRGQFLASSAGILVSFWLLASFLLALKLTGSAVGWGIQFQNPWFIGFMVVITTVFGANMLGLFEINLSSNTNTWLASKGGHSYSGHFVQGMFATLLATPCSAPFLGTAIAFALAASSIEMFAVFTALGIGMALPWILVATFPGLASFLPKPGPWMKRVKQLFGVMMLLTSVWLLSLLGNFLPASSVEKSISSTAQELPWQPLSETLIEQSVGEGKTVFVDVTAAWCVTCKANKVGVILQDPVYSTLKKGDIVLVQGDWTHPGETVTSFLRKHNRYGVPFNIVYGPNAPQGIALPVILSKSLVMDAIAKAQGQSD